MSRTLNVWWDSHLVGRLSQDRSGELGFVYDPAWVGAGDARAISVCLPKRIEPFSRQECRPFFAGLLPDESQRRMAAQALGVSNANDFALLNGMGGDVAGALQLLPPETLPSRRSYAPQAEGLSDAALVAILKSLPVHPLLAGEAGLRLSLAGAQSKLPVVLVDGAVALPTPGQPTTHILKPPIALLRGTTENEAAVMRLARAAGLDAAAVAPRLVEGQPFLLVERYDRAQTGDGRTRRLHQEDFCQALGIPPERKYASEGGPVFKDCFDLVRRVSSLPGRDALKLLDAAIFNLVVGNADAHGKNFSLLTTPAGLRLAPLYDLLSTVRYPSLAANSAMKLGRTATLDTIDEAAWQRFAADAGVTIPYLRRRVADLCDILRLRVHAASADVWQPGLDEQVLSELADDIARRAEVLALKRPTPLRSAT